ncbi:MAG: thiamine phosphate synthase [Acidobacteria bacterium]|nr:thiamine phosphate synthase [Acidobacteriota bacterium]
MPSLPKLYAILDIDTLHARGLEPRAVFDVWLRAGIRLIQLRAKTMPGGAMLTLADALVADARSAGATVIINDRADIARLACADGVHVGQGDLTPAQVATLRPGGHDASRATAPWCIGLSTHTLDHVRAGLETPADYLAIGPVFSTVSKADADPAVGLDTVRAAASVAGDRPLVAIGGITMANAPAVLAAGAASVAVISDLLVGDFGDRARQFLANCQ